MAQGNNNKKRRGGLDKKQASVQEHSQTKQDIFVCK